MILRPEDNSVLTATTSLTDKWDEKHPASGAGARYTFEVTEMDTPTDPAFHLDMSSFKTGISTCHALDVVYQLADDSLVESADLVAFATWSGLGSNVRGMGLRATS